MNINQLRGFIAPVLTHFADKDFAAANARSCEATAGAIFDRSLIRQLDCRRKKAGISS